MEKESEFKPNYRKEVEIKESIPSKIIRNIDSSLVQEDALIGTPTEDIGKKGEPKYSITLNQFAQFIDATESVQQRIVNGQKNPPEESFFWYQSTKAAIRKSIAINNEKPIYESIRRLKATVAIGKHKETNRILSITGLEKYLQISLPLYFRQFDKIIIKPKKKHLDYNGIRIKITPDVVFKGNFQGKNFIGAVKLNINKTKPFNKLRRRVVSSILYKYLQKHVAEGNEIVDPQLCLCIDVFDQTFMAATKIYSAPNLEIIKGCEGIMNTWEKIA